MTDTSVGPRRTGPSPWAVALGFVVLVLGGLLWAKWAPYWVKVPSVAGSHSLGPSILTGGEPAPPGVSLSAGLRFAGSYFLAIWPALVVGLVLAAAVQVALPRAWLTRLFGGTEVAGGVRGSVLALPSMMCSCCAAPLAVGLRRRAAGLTATLAYWLGNPALNPVVLVFCAFVLPWEWTLLRALAGVVVVVSAVALGRRWAARTPVVDDAGSSGVVPDEPVDDRPLTVRFLAALGGLAIRLLPEYLLLVVVLGAFRGVLFPVGASWPSGTGTGVALAVAAVVLLAVAGALLPIPTGAEVAVVAALLAVGVPGALAAALLITLPALSLPSLLMVRNAFPRRLLVTVTGVVVGVGLLTSVGALAVGL